MQEAVVLVRGTPNTVELRPVPTPQLRSKQVLVNVRACALNHRDLWILVDKYPGIVDHSILGADGSGVVVDVGSDVPASLRNTEVVINPSINFGTKGFHILGMLPAPGTFCEYLAVDESLVFPKPAFLSHVEAAALCLAGLTAYRAVVSKAQVKAGDTVLVTGIGGGVALFAAQFAIAIGAKVFVTSSDASKIERAVQLGALKGVKYTNDRWTHEILEFGPFDAVIDGSGGEAVNEYIKVLKTGGSLVMYGATVGRCRNIDLHRMFLKNVEIKGTTMGSAKEFGDMLDFVTRHGIRPVVDGVFPLHQYREAFERLKQARHFGKVVMTLPTRANL